MRKPVIIVDKRTHAATRAADAHEINLTARSVVELPVTRAEVKFLARDGNSLVIILTSGEVIVIRGFFVDGQEGRNTLVLQSDDGLWIADPSGVEHAPAGEAVNPTPGTFQSIDSIEPLLDQSSPNGLPIFLAAAGFTTALAAAASTGSSSKPRAPTILLHQNPDGTLTVQGKAQPGHAVLVHFPDGSAQTVNTDAKGNYAATSTQVQTSGPVDATATRPGGDSSDTVHQDWTDTTPPQSPTVAVTPNSDHGVTVTGQAEPGSKVTVQYPDGSTDTVMADDDGHYTITTHQPQPGGQVEVTATDQAGNTSESAYEQYTHTVMPPEAALSATDNVGPITGPIVPGGSTDDTAPALNGAGATLGDTVTIYDGDTQIGKATVQDDGTWEFTPETPLDERDHSLSYTYTDSTGTESDKSPPLNFTVDITPPDTPVTAPEALDSVEPVVGPITDGGCTNDQQPVFSGSGATPGDTIILYDGDKPVGSAIVDSDGNWSVQPDTNLDDGDHSLSYTETDPAGNESGKSPVLNFTVDTIAPDTPTSSPAATDNVEPVVGPITDGASTNDSKPVFSGSGATPGDTIILYDGDKPVGSAIVDSDGNWSVQPDTNLDDGDHSLSYTETDPAGNESGKSPTLNFTVDTIAPNTPDSSPTATDNVEPVVGPITDGASTNDPKPVFSGSGAMPGDTIILYDGDKPVGSAIVDSNGNWSVQPDEKLDDGSHSLSYTETDPAGNESGKSPVLNFTVDTLAPDTPTSSPAAMDNVEPIVGSITDGTSTNDPKPVFSGSGATPGDTITLYDDDKPVGSTVVDSDGNWSVQPDEKLDDGSHSLSYTETDPAGNESGKSPALNFTVDTIAPDTPASSPAATDNVEPILGQITDGTSTNDPKPVFSGSGATPGDTIILYDGDKPVGSAIVDSNGNWSVQPDTNLDDGDHSLSYTETDPAGNESGKSPALNFTVDTIAPDTPASSPAAMDNVEPVVGPITDGASTNDPKPVFSGSGATPGDTIILYDGDKPVGSAIVDSDGNWSVQPDEKLDDGSHSLSYTETDPAGNESGKSPTLDFTVDTIAPNTPASSPTATDNVEPVVGPITDGTSTNDSKPAFSGSGATPGDTIILYDGDKPVGSAIVDSNGNWSVQPDTKLDDGNHSLSYTETDPAGNESGKSPTLNFTVDTIAPDTPASSPAATDNVEPVVGPITDGGSTNDPKPVFSGSGATPGDTIILYDGDKPVGSAIVDPDGTWSVQPDIKLDDGDHSLSYTETDPAGNESGKSPTLNFTVDTIAPDTPASSPAATDNVEPVVGPITDGTSTNDPKPVFSGSSATPGDTITLYDGDKPVGSAIVDSDGNWSVQPDEKLDDGSHSLSYTKTDPAGNESGKSPALNFTVDTIAPDTPVSSPAATDNVEPVVGSITDGASTNDPKPVFSGSGATPGDTITLYDGDKPVGSATVNPDGTWSVQPDAKLDDGNHSLSYTETDPAGNESGKSPTLDFTVDTIAPNTPASSPTATDNVEPVVGPITDGASTNDPKPVFSGSGATPGDTIILYDGDKPVGSAIVDSDGNWSVQPDEKLDDGSHSLSYTETDLAGNESGKSPTLNFTVDTVAPDTPASSPAATDNVEPVVGPITGGGSTNDPKPVFSGNGATPGDTIILYDGDKPVGSAIVDSNGNWSVQPDEKLDDGSHSLSYTETDPAGNESGKSPALNFTVDTVAPDTPASSPAATDNIEPVVGPITDGTSTNDPKPVFSGSGATPGDTITLYDGDKPVGSTVVDSDGNWSVQPDEKLDDGSHSLSYTETDPAGNESGKSPALNFTVDTVAPDTPASSPAATDNVEPIVGPITDGASTNDPKPVFSGSGATPGDTITLYDGDKPVGSATVNPDGTWSVQPDAKLDDGSHSLSYSYTDPAGNESGQSPALTFTVDTQIDPPTGTITTNPDHSVTLSGTAEPGSIVHVQYPDGSTGSAQAGADGKYEIITSPAPQGSGDATISATDAAGNISPDVTAPYTDTTPPDMSAAHVAIDAITGDGVISSAEAASPAVTLTGVYGNLPSDAVNPIVTVQIDGHSYTATVKPDGTWSVDVPGSELATSASLTVHATLQAKDAAGNLSDPVNAAPQHYTVDTNLPIISISTPIAGDNIVNLAESQSPVTLSGKTLNVEAGQVVQIKAGGVSGSATVQADGSWSVALDLSSLPDSDSITVTADVTNQAGSPAHASANIGKDTVAPFDNNAVAITAYFDDVGALTGDFHSGTSTDDPSPLLKGTVAGLMNGDTVEIFQNNVHLGSATISGDRATWSYQLTGLPEGSYTYKAVITDHALNPGTTSAPFTLTVDLTPPDMSHAQVSIDPVTGDGVINAAEAASAAVALTGQYSGLPADAINPVITVYIDGAGYSGTVNPDGTWSVNVPGSVLAGAHTGQVDATLHVTDAAGNPASVDAPPVTYTVDTSAASISITTPIAGDNIVNLVESQSPVLISGNTLHVEAGQVVQVKVGGVSGSATVQADGSWSVALDLSALPDGDSITVTADVTSQAGNPAHASAGIAKDTAPPGGTVVIVDYYDDVAPQTGPFGNNTATNDTMPLLRGTVSGLQSGDTIEIFQNNIHVGSAAVNSDGVSWSYQISSALAQGPYTYTAMVVNHAGNSGATSNAFTLTVDTTPPPDLVVLDLVDNVLPVTGTIDKNGVTDDPRPVYSGTANAADTVLVIIYDNGQIIGSTTVGADGAWSFQPSASHPLGSGSHSLQAQPVDAAGNMGNPSAAWAFTLLGDAPAAPAITSVLDDYGPVTGLLQKGDVTDDKTPTVSGTSAPGTTVKLYVDGVESGSYQVGEDGVWTITVNPPISGPDGVKNITAQAFDAAGQASPETGVYPIVLATTPPTKQGVASALDQVGPQTGPIYPNTTTDDSQPKFSGDGEPGATVTIYDNNIVIGTAVVDAAGQWSFTPTQPLFQGQNAITTTQTDAAGNTSPMSDALVFTVDTSAVEIAITKAFDDFGPITGNIANGGATDDKTPTLFGTGTPNAIVTISEGGQTYGSTQIDAQGSWQFQLPTQSDATHTYTATAQNPAGAQVSASFTLTIDTQPPAVPSIDSVYDDVGAIQGDLVNGARTDDTTPTLYGSGATPGDTINIYINNQLAGSVLVDGQGNWNYTPTSTLDEGAYTFTVSASNPLGTESGQSAPFTLTVDTTPPDMSHAKLVIDPVAGDNIINAAEAAQPSTTLTGSFSGLPVDALNPQVELTLDGVTYTATVTGTHWSVDVPTAALVNSPTDIVQAKLTVNDEAGNPASISATPQPYTLSTGQTSISITTPIAGDNIVNAEEAKSPVIISGHTSGVEDGQTVTLNIGGIAATAVVSGDSWSAALDLSALPDGAGIKITAAVSDKAGNAAPEAVAFIDKDTLPPNLSGAQIAIDAITGDDIVNQAEAASQITLTGVYGGLPGDAINSSVTVTIDGASFAAALDAAHGAWSVTVDGSVLAQAAAGSVKATLHVLDAAGNAAQIDATRAYTVDTTAPDLSQAAITINAITGDNVINIAEAAGQITLSGAYKDLPGDALDPSVTVTIDGASFAAALDAALGTWSVTVDGGVLANAATSTVTATLQVHDAAGNPASKEAAQDYTVRLTPVDNVAVISAIQDDTGIDPHDFITADNTLCVSVTVDKPLTDGQIVQISVDGGQTWHTAAPQGDGSYQYDNTANPLPDGTYTFQARVVDDAGNPGAAASQQVTIDTAAPQAIPTITSYTDDVGKEQGNFPSGTTTDDRQPVLNGTLDRDIAPGEYVAVYEGATLIGHATMNPGSSRDWSLQLPSLADGSTHTYTARVVDLAGNQGSPSSDFVLLVDLTIIVNPQSTTDTTPLVIGSTGFSILPGEYLEVTINGHTYSSQDGVVMVDLANNTWAVQVPDAHALKLGTYDVVAVLKEANGNVITTDDTASELKILPSPVITFTATGADAQDTGTAITLSEDGAWRILTNSVVFTQNGKDAEGLGSFASAKLATMGNDRQQQSTFVDFNRDGLPDILGAGIRYANGQHSFQYDGTTYTPFYVGAYNVAGQTNNANANTYVWYGGAVGIDLNGDGYVDVIYGDETPNDANARGGYDTTFVINTDGTILGFAKSGAYVDTQTSQNGVPATNSGNPTPDREIAGVDLNNDGYVDIVYHGTLGTNRTDAGGSSGANSRLVVVTNGVDGSGNMTLTNTQIVTGVFNGDNAADDVYTTLTWADLNGDGYMDLFVAGLGGATAANSKIYYNDGAGRLVSAANGVGAGSQVQNLADTVNSNTSLALDWNCDGRMDLIEIAGTSGSTATGNANNVGLLWINNGLNPATGMVNWAPAQTLLTNANLSSANFVTGALAVDLDWNGAQDLVVFRAQGGATAYIENPNKVQDGTSIIVRILDANGINAYYGNTVLLIDEATGKIVSSQIINPQGGVNMNNSTGLVYFYGLDAGKKYSVELLASNSQGNNSYGGASSVYFDTSGKTIVTQNVNAAWSGLTAVDANHCYVLTAESGAKASNPAQAATDATNTVGIVGTGYNDTFYATAGAHIYNGAGGSERISDAWVWSSTSGQNIVDYKLAGNTPLTIDLSLTGQQDTGFGKATFVNIQGIAGGGGDDIFTDGPGNNIFEGRGGNDTFNLIHGGNNTLLYRVLTSDPTGGNGQDQVNGFKVGLYEATPNADRIDLADLLIGYKPSGADGSCAKYINGVATINPGDNIESYLQITHSGTDTILSIDRDGAGSAFAMTQIITLHDVTTDLATLLANHQIVVG